MSQIRAGLRAMRILHSVFLVTIALFTLVIFQVHPEERAIGLVTPAVLSFVCVVNIMTAVRFRSRWITPSVVVLQKNSEDIQALGMWRAGHVISFTFAESIALFGLVLKFVGANWNLAGPFFGVAVFLFLIWRPKLEIAAPD